MENETFEHHKEEYYRYTTYNIFAYIIAVLLSPLLGFIMGVVGVTQRKKYAWSIIIVSILGWVLNAYFVHKL